MQEIVMGLFFLMIGIICIGVGFLYVYHGISGSILTLSVRRTKFNSKTTDLEEYFSKDIARLIKGFLGAVYLCLGVGAVYIGLLVSEIL